MPDQKTIKILGTLREMKKKDISSILKLHHETHQDYKLKYKMS